MMRTSRHDALVAIGQAVVYVQGIARACYSHGAAPTLEGRRTAIGSLAVHSFIVLFTLTPWGRYTNKLSRSEMLFRYKELELGL